MGTVILPTDLSQASIEKILQDFYKYPSLKVVNVSGQETFLGANENFCSTIKSWTVTVQQVLILRINVLKKLDSLVF